MSAASTGDRAFASRLKQIAFVARVVAALAIIAVGGRYAFVAAKVLVATPDVPAVPDSETAAPNSTPAPNDVTTGPAPVRATTHNTKRVTAMITVPPDQSEIFIDGAHIGKTPYMGNVDCDAGARVHVKLVPPTGAPVEFDRDCDSRSLEINSKP